MLLQSSHFVGYRLRDDGKVVYTGLPIIAITTDGIGNEKPTPPKIVQITPTDTDRVTLAWLPVQSDTTSATAMRYEVHISEQPNFQPTTATLRQTIVGNAQATITGLSAGKDYFVVVRALDSAGKYSQNEELRTFATFSEPVIVNPNVTIIEDKSVGLGQATQQGDTYVYQNTSGNPPSVGTILFANVGDETHLRKVESVTPTGNGLSVQTTDVELTEVLQQGTVSSEVVLFDVDAEAARIGQRSSVRTSRTARKGSQQTIMRWQDDVLVAEQQNFDTTHRSRATVKQKIELDASVKFTPSLRAKFSWRNVPGRGIVFTSGEVIARGQFSADANAFYNFEAADSAKKEIDLFKNISTLRYLVGGVPMYQRNILTVKAVLSAEASSEIKANAGANATAAVEMGARLNPTTGSWQPIPPTPSFEKSFKTGLEVNGTVHGEIRLIPNLQVEFYRVVAADLSIEPSITADIGAGLIPKGELLAEFGYAPIQFTKFDINLQAEAFVGVSVGIFSKKQPILDKTKIWGSPQWLLFSLPELSVTGGSGKVNEAINLTATTKDGKNDPFKDGSIKWFVSPNKATISGGKAGTFTSSSEGSYTVFFSGHGYLGDPLARQFASAEVTVGKKDEKTESSVGHGIPNQCYNIPNRCHGLPNRCNNSPAGGSYDEDGHQHGVWIEIFDNGDYSVDTYNHQIHDGLHGVWKANCSPISQCNQTADKLEGVCTVIDESGRYSMNTYHDNVLNGLSGEWNADCSPNDLTIDGTGNYLNGEKDGIWTRLLDIGGFTIKTYVNGVLNGYSGQWKADCSPVGQHVNYVNGKWDGTMTHIHDDGDYSTNTFVNGILNGPSGEWKADGSPKLGSSHGSYANGVEVGIWTYYCDYGDLSKTTTITYSANGDFLSGEGSCYPD